MGQRKTEIRFFTIADFIEGENWLREQQKSGWKLIKTTLPCFFTFEECIPEDVIYRLDFKNNKEKADYMQMVNDFGWEYCAECLGWLYFRKSAAKTENTGDSEIFSDNESRLDMLEHILKARLLPLFIVFLCAVIPNMINTLYHQSGYFLMVAYSAIFVLYAFLLIYCWIKLKKIRQGLR